MKRQNINYLHISTILAFILIPLGGLTTDIYIPSLPAMSKDLNVPIQSVQLSLLLFMVSSGLSQIFIGSLLDSFGRYRINIIALIIFSVASFVIASVPNIHLIYAMRIIQGITVSLIIVGKRAFFVDMFTGQKLKHYTSLFSIVWAAAPIIAPFIGGYLQVHLNWQANFYLLSLLTAVVLLFEIRYTGESLQTFQKFDREVITNIYKKLLGSADFGLGLVIIGLSYSLLVIYGMVSPFFIEAIFRQSPIVTGYSSLASGIALMSGGIISKLMINKPFMLKIRTAVVLQLLVAMAMCLSINHFGNLTTLMAFTLPIHLLSGFIFNNVYAYCLQRFTINAGTASGLTGGGVYVVSATVGYGLINLISIKSLLVLAQINLGIVFMLTITIWLLANQIKSKQFNS